MWDTELTYASVSAFVLFLKCIDFGPPGWGFDVPLAMALCKNLPAENTQ